MTQHDPLVSLQHMRDYAQEALDMSAGRSEDELRSDRILSLAITRSVEIVGEAANRIPDDARLRFPDIPWQEIRGMRNRLIHAYDLISEDVLWDTVLRDLPELIKQLEAAIDELSS